MRGDFGSRGAGFGELRQLTKRARFRRLIAWTYRFPRRGSWPSGFCKFWEMFLDILEAPRFANSAEYPEFSRFRNERLEWDRVHGGFGRRGAGFGKMRLPTRRARFRGLKASTPRRSGPGNWPLSFPIPAFRLFGDIRNFRNFQTSPMSQNFRDVGSCDPGRVSCLGTSDTREPGSGCRDYRLTWPDRGGYQFGYPGVLSAGTEPVDSTSPLSIFAIWELAARNGSLVCGFQGSIPSQSGPMSRADGVGIPVSWAQEPVLRVLYPDQSDSPGSSGVPAMLKLRRISGSLRDFGRRGAGFGKLRVSANRARFRNAKGFGILVSGAWEPASHVP